jgi:FtsP/CotA-like multicopper oxidase with cupredoxin domain
VPHQARPQLRLPCHPVRGRRHAHCGFVIHPNHSKKKREKVVEEEMPPIILGEWWRDDDVNQLLVDAMRTGRDVKPSDANTINGWPGDDLHHFCSSNYNNDGTFKVRVERGKTYLLRVINADMFFGVAGHRLTVVAIDAGYTKPFTVEHVMVASGQTLDLLLHAKNDNGGRYYMAARTSATDTAIAYNNSTATAILEYDDDGRKEEAAVVPGEPACRERHGLGSGPWPARSTPWTCRRAWTSAWW